MQNLGLDAHSMHFVLAHVNDRGKLCRQYDRPTTAKSLIEVVGRIPGPKRLAVDPGAPGHLAQWTKHVLEAYVDELIVCDPKHNRWISEADFADDKTSALKLALLMHGGFLKPIRHPDDVGAELRSVFLHYYNLNRHIVRFKNMLKATFRQVAVLPPKNELYTTDDRDGWLNRLKDFPALAHRANHCFQLLDATAEMKEQAYDAMVKRAKKSAAFELLQTAPGIGPIIASGYIALIDTPHRFSRKNKLWAYACLGNKYHESDRAVYSNRPSKTGCRPLKWLVMQQFNVAVSKRTASNRFSRQHAALLRTGLGKRTVRRQVCRNMLSMVRALWIKGQAYRDDA